MRTILFCQNNYAFGILEPIKEVLIEKDYPYTWFITDKLVDGFPFTSDDYTTEISDLKNFKSDAIFVPGNEVPYYLRGLKVQVFHGLAGEKKGHFRIRHYFDLYLTQGPYFTRGFDKFKAKYKNFEVIETGWPKLDIYGKDKLLYQAEKKKLLNEHKANTIVLYAPTFSPSLTSAPHLIEEIKRLSSNSDYLILIKFHPLMDNKWIEAYKELANSYSNIKFQDEKNIIKFLLMADLMISDTSSVIYEFLLLDKPVITFKNISKKIHWEDSDDYGALINLVERNLNEDPFAEQRKTIFNEFHPYNDGKSALRMVEAVEDYIEKNGVPEKRKLSFLRRRKIHSIFGK
ncbi:CDP-glycerol glycerophosphotransferase family protein [Winogradskyella flava]|uniref:CDP-glycerol glycerophosphotransferase family protein n=1 Tax=Winogradskyella flava TaxID=1884876 RepID=A0A842IU30_9FLAO|nr:CDP-glycerol glycerophosphotransferase family protein [Winogradskyella flava]MBC2845659.1 CDP-glycerol glycerophosphotransferase family protein [Winogradskyella flava]